MRGAKAENAIGAFRNPRTTAAFSESILENSDGLSNLPKLFRRVRCGGREAIAAHDALNAGREAQGEPVLPLDIALNSHGVVYGNVGAIRRLDFNVIGRAVHETCRVEAPCGNLGRNTLFS